MPKEFLFAWRKAIASKRGPRSPTTRLVLLVLYGYMNVQRHDAWPSIATLAIDAGLSSRAVGIHLQNAEQDGWITRKRWRDKGKNWAGYLYVPSLPKAVEAQEPRSSPSEHAEEARSKGAEPHSNGQESDSTLVGNDVPTNSLENSLENSSEILKKLPNEMATLLQNVKTSLQRKTEGHIPTK